MADQPPVKKGFRPKVGVKVGPEQPLPADIRTDTTVAIPQMFARKDKPVASKPVVVPAIPVAVKPRLAPIRPAQAAVPEVVPAPAPVPAAEPPKKRKVTVLPPTSVATAPATATASIPAELEALQSSIDAEESKNPYVDPVPTVYTPENRIGFQRFIQSYYAKDFSLPPILSKKINPNACSEMKLQTYKYQAFIREYMRQASPYRGVLVYHGLGSGKTCTSIAAAEALYGQGKRKIIVMTPTSLQENFINEIMFCGFRHFHIKNFWVPFTFENPAVRMFAEQVAGIPATHLHSVRGKAQNQRVFWMPDMTKSEAEIAAQQKEFEGDWQQSAIREQLYAIIKHRITFIGYTGMSASKLKEIAVNNPTFFDDAVIIIDEIHNLTRLMAGKIDIYFKPKTKFYEPVTVDTWDPKVKEPIIIPGKDGKPPKNKEAYTRAYLFYRLLEQAKNSKIIALSGTPIVNTPVEVSILSNILHGYFHGCTVNFLTVDPAAIKAIINILNSHPRVSFYSLTKQTGQTQCFFTILEEGYMKKFGTNGEFIGLIYVGPAAANPPTIQTLFAEIEQAVQTKLRVAKKGDPDFKAYPVLPPMKEDFKNNFIDLTDETNLKMKNTVVFTKRISGLISYYRGSKEELMPKIVSDEIVECPFSDIQLPQYVEARLAEIEAEKKKKKKTKRVDEILEEKEAASYRFRSRAFCNFSFPKDINRPFPTSKKEAKMAMDTTETLVGDGVTDLVINPTAVADAEADEAAAREEDDEQADAMEDEENGVAAERTVAAAAPKEYAAELAQALAELREQSPNLFSMNPARPEKEQLQTYSKKFAEIYKRIVGSKGSSLVYSQFKTVEGIDVFAMALQVNNFAPIRIIGPETDLELAPETVASIRDSPEQPRYIVYSGSETLRIRQTLINVFNMRTDKLPNKIADVLMGSPLYATKNMKGEVCKAFMITGAGAEGLSLKNVRTVHIMDPFWNKVRTDQVKGRAIRICSHSDLHYDEDPAKNERTVEIFTYISVFPKGKRIDQTLVLSDGSETTDQYIYDLATQKDAISSEFLTAMKAGAVDCLLNSFENEKIQCYVQEGPVADFLYDPRLEKDIESTGQEVRAAAPTAAAPVPVVGPAIAAARAPPPPVPIPSAFQLTPLERLGKHVRNFYTEIGADQEQLNKVPTIVEKYKGQIWLILANKYDKTHPGVVAKHQAEWKAGVPKAEEAAPAPPPPVAVAVAPAAPAPATTIRKVYTRKMGEVDRLKKHVVEFYKEIGANKDQIDNVPTIVESHKDQIWKVLEEEYEKDYPGVVAKHEAKWKTDIAPIQYYGVPSPDGSKETLYLVTDLTRTTPKGEMRRDPVTGKPKATYFA